MLGSVSVARVAKERSHSATRDVHALTRIPVTAGPVAAAIDHALNGFDTETVVVSGLVASQRRCGIPYEDAASSRTKDMVALDNGALDRGIDRYPAAGSVTHAIASHHIANRMGVIGEERDRDAVSHDAVALDPVAVALQDDPVLGVVAYPVVPDVIVVRLDQVDAQFGVVHGRVVRDPVAVGLEQRYPDTTVTTGVSRGEALSDPGTDRLGKKDAAEDVLDR